MLFLRCFKIIIVYRIKISQISLIKLIDLIFITLFLYLMTIKILNNKYTYIKFSCIQVFLNIFKSLYICIFILFSEVSLINILRMIASKYN